MGNPQMEEGEGMPVKWRALVKSMLVRLVGLWNRLVLVLALVKSMLVRPVGLWNRPRTGNADGQVASGRGVPLRNCVGKKAERG